MSGDKNPIDGRAALVTGGGRGIGAAIAKALAAQGARVLVNDLDAAPAQEVVDAIAAAGGTAKAFSGNVCDADFGERAVAACVDAFGGLHILVNNAGYTWDGALHKMTDAQWAAMLDVHLTAPFRLLRAAYPVLKAQYQRDQEAGRIVHRKVVNVSSVVGLGGNAGQANYAAAKAGVIGLTKSLAKEWGRLAVNVNCVAYGHIETRLTQSRSEGATVQFGDQQVAIGVNPELLRTLAAQIPLGRAGSIEEAAGAVLMFCGAGSDYVSGQVLVCGGGMTLG